jgi:hypothetical protein
MNGYRRLLSAENGRAAAVICRGEFHSRWEAGFNV